MHLFNTFLKNHFCNIATLQNYIIQNIIYLSDISRICKIFKILNYKFPSPGIMNGHNGVVSVTHIKITVI